MVGSAAILPLSNISPVIQRHPADCQQLATILVGDLVVTTAPVDQLPEVVGSTIVLPLSNLRSIVKGHSADCQ